tara:strand:- start:87 stop:1736 length:1650 start_codon:yes stop_codon:yes gene_type:complete
MKLATLQAGQFVETGGYYVKGDAGQAKYLVVAAQAADGYGDHTLANGTVAVLQVGDVSDLEQWGVSGEVSTDNLVFAAAVTYLNGLYVLDNIPRNLRLSSELITTSALRILSGVHFINNGTVTFAGDVNQGSVMLIRSSTDCGITSDSMGVIDGGGIGNVNGIGVSGRTDLGGESRRIIINNQLIKGCRSNHTVPSEIGNKGGKGLSVQTGPRSVLIDTVYIEDCDIGYGFEASIGNDGKCEVQMTNVRARSCAWIGGLYWGSFSSEPSTGDFFDITTSNIVLEDCGMSVSTTDGFAPIVFNAAYQVRGDIKVLNKTGTGLFDIIRGSSRFCDLKVFADVSQVRHTINHEEYSGYSPVSTKSEHNTITVRVKSRSAADVTGYVLRGKTGTDVVGGVYKFYVNEWDGIDYLDAGWAGGTYENVDTRASIHILDGNQYQSIVKIGPSFHEAVAPVSAADDTVITKQMYSSFGFAGVAVQTATNRTAFVHFDSDGTLACNGTFSSAQIEFTTGALTGTTGTNGFLTISIDSDSVLYVENRLGAPVPILIKQL